MPTAIITSPPIHLIGASKIHLINFIIILKTNLKGQVIIFQSIPKKRISTLPMIKI